MVADLRSAATALQIVCKLHQEHMLLVDVYVAEHILETESRVLLLINLVLLPADIALPEIRDGVLSTLASVHAPYMDALALAVNASNSPVLPWAHVVIEINLSEFMSASLTEYSLDRFIWLLLLLLFDDVVNIPAENVF